MRQIVVDANEAEVLIMQHGFIYKAILPNKKVILERSEYVSDTHRERARRASIPRSRAPQAPAIS